MIFRRELGLATDSRRVSPAERGIAQMMVSLCRRFEVPLDSETLRAWHAMLLHGRRDLREMGYYRIHPRADIHMT